MLSTAFLVTVGYMVCLWVVIWGVLFLFFQVVVWHVYLICVSHPHFTCSVNCSCYGSGWGGGPDLDRINGLGL